MSKIIQITTVEGQRWDQIALDAYGSADMMNQIITANPAIPMYDILPGGIVLDIPIIEAVEVKSYKQLLPPWKQ